MSDESFVHNLSRFRPADESGGVAVPDAEAQYAELFAEVIWDGVITPNKRQRLQNAIELFGLDPPRAESIEAGLRASYEAITHQALMVEEGSAELDLLLDSDLPESEEPVSLADDDIEPVDDEDVQQLDSDMVQLSDSDLVQLPDSDMVQLSDSDMVQLPDSDMVQLPDSDMVQLPDSEAAPAADAGGKSPSKEDTALSPLAESDDPRLQALQLRIRALERENEEFNDDNCRLMDHVDQLEELVEQLQGALQSTLQELDDTHKELGVAKDRSKAPGDSLAPPASQAPPTSHAPPASQAPPASHAPPTSDIPPVSQSPTSLISIPHSMPMPPQSLTQPRTGLPPEEDLDWSETPATRDADARTDPDKLHALLASAPADLEILHDLFQALRRADDEDRRWRLAHTLVYLGEANDEERDLFSTQATRGLVEPSRAINEDEWRELLFHPDEDRLTGEILAEIAPAILLGKLVRSSDAQDTVDEAEQVADDNDEIQAVRCFRWAAAFLGLSEPALYASPSADSAAEMLLCPTPATRLGKRALVGRTSKELAFLAGQHMCWYRKEHLLGKAARSMRELEDTLLAALAIGNPGLPMTDDVRSRVELLTKVLSPLVDEDALDRLEGCFTRFVEAGATADVVRWHRAVERTANCTGLLLANDLRVTKAMLRMQRADDLEAEMNDLILFYTSKRCSALRRAVGIAVDFQEDA